MSRIDSNPDEERVRTWLEGLEEEEKEQVEVLDAYFTFRRNMPGDDPGFGPSIAEPKTTDDIVDELLPMMPVTQKVVAGYMRAHGYGYTTMGDGSVKWAVWRFVDVTVLT